jgi:hypothetical protein
MAESRTFYKNIAYLTQLNSPEFDQLHAPGTAAPHSGIYRCEGCGHSIASNLANPLPPQNHHHHSPAQGQIRWRMIVWA